MNSRPSRRQAGWGLVLGIVLLIAITSHGSDSKPTSAVPVAPPATTTRPAAPHHHARPRRKSHHPAAGGTSAGCPSAQAALDGVYHPQRLTVINPCQRVTGTVEQVRTEQDGDVHYDVGVDAPYRQLLSAGNDAGQHGWLLIELMPRDGGHLSEPAAGDRVVLVGALVDDTDHGWREIHPVWSQSINGGPAQHSGPQFGGSPSYDRSSDAAAGCQTQRGAPCAGYGAPSYRGSPPASGPPPPPPGGASFCTNHPCIPSFAEGTGYVVQCADGMWSHSGGRRGVCSGHGGVKP